MKKKIFLTVFLLCILLANISFASYSTVTMSVVEEPVCTIEFGEHSKFEKKLVAKNLNEKEVTLQLQVTNEEEALKPTGEIVIVLDNSYSMNNQVTTGEIRKDLIFESAKTLISNILEDNESLKVGLVTFSTNTDVSKEGTTEDASVLSTLSNDVTTLTNAISSIEADGPRTDLEAGLSLASSQFSEEANNKYIIVLTDGVPNVALNYDKTYYSDDVINKTKTQLQTLETNGIEVVTMLTGINDESYVPSGVTKSYGEIISEIFGTPENPTVGNFYYVTDDKIETTIKTDIYNDLLPIARVYKNIKVVDYFPQEIIDNFDFAYVSDANIGTISAEVDKTNNSITWTIPELASGETATVQYTLKLKEDFSSSIVDKILDTNEKVDITYTDFNDEEQAKTSDVTPKLKLTEPPAELPKAGMTTLLVTLGVGLTGLLVFSYIKWSNLKRNMK